MKGNQLKYGYYFHFIGGAAGDEDQQINYSWPNVK